MNREQIELLFCVLAFAWITYMAIKHKVHQTDRGGFRLILLIFVIFLYWIAIPLLILGLFLGFRYQIAGPDLENDTINGMMDSAASTAADVGRQVMDELKNQHEKYNNRKK